MAVPDIIEAAEIAMSRDPRYYPVGYLSGAAEGPDRSTMFSWFRSIDDLLDFLHDVEPKIWDLNIGEGVEEYQVALSPLLNTIRYEGLTEELRTALNSALAPTVTVHWWGRFDDLCKGTTAKAREVVADYREAGEFFPIEKQEHVKFIEFLREYGA
jgi:hypothetical protein